MLRGKLIEEEKKKVDVPPKNLKEHREQQEKLRGATIGRQPETAKDDRSHK